MYIIETFKRQIKIDADELQILHDNAKAPLIFFRQGAVNPKHIIAVIEDVERKQEVMKLAGETTESYQQRILSEKSPDIFSELRLKTQALPTGANVKQLT